MALVGGVRTNMWRHLEGSGISGCGEISRKYSIWGKGDEVKSISHYGCSVKDFNEIQITYSATICANPLALAGGINSPRSE